MTPDAFRAFYESFAPFIGVLIGIVVKFVPALKAVPNAAIGWINAVTYVLVSVLTGIAQAGVEGVSFASVAPPPASLAVGAVTNAGLAFMIWETLGRTLIEKWLRWKQPA